MKLSLAEGEKINVTWYNCSASSVPKQCPLPVVCPPFVPNRIEWQETELLRGTTPAAAVVPLLTIMQNGFARRGQSIKIPCGETRRTTRRGDKINPPTFVKAIVTLPSPAFRKTRPMTNSIPLSFMSLQVSAGDTTRGRNVVNIHHPFFPSDNAFENARKAKKCATNQNKGRPSETPQGVDRTHCRFQ